MMEWLEDASTLVGLAWGWPLITGSVVVVLLYGKATWAAYRTSAKIRSRVHWLALGISTAYAGESVDDLYWALTWSMHYLDWSAAQWWLEFGPVPNVPFRNILGTAGVYCHIRAVLVQDEATAVQRVKQLNRCVLFTLLIGHLFAFMLFLLKQQSS